MLQRLAARLQQRADRKRAAHRTPGQKLAAKVQASLANEETVVGSFVVTSHEQGGFTGNSIVDLLVFLATFASGEPGRRREARVVSLTNEVTVFHETTNVQGRIPKVGAMIGEVSDTAIGPVAGGMVPTITIAGQKWFVSPMFADEARRLHRLSAARKKPLAD